MKRWWMCVGLLLLACKSPQKTPDLMDASFWPADQRGGGPVDLSRPADQALPANDMALFVPPGYPAGPYGVEIGDVMAPMAWEGYVNLTATALSTTQPFGAYSMNDMRLSGAKFALVYAADTF